MHSMFIHVLDYPQESRIELFGVPTESTLHKVHLSHNHRARELGRRNYQIDEFHEWKTLEKEPGRDEMMRAHLRVDKIRLPR
mmetsp:Transcript_10198/g.16677  ORF Transcript_10198/g.16677 Transcript_10198/m.16677 type:complete len:82 (-) Transcript_10198:1863-2108(-)